MRQIIPLALLMLLATAPVHLSSAVAASTGARSVAGNVVLAQAAATVKVTVHYKGKGTVDAKHRIWVWLFDTPDIGPGSMPIAELSMDASGNVAEFEGIDAKQVWIAAAYDESGTMAGNGPPPPGSPVGILLSEDGKPRSVVPGEETVVMTFDDTQRMP